MEEEPVEVLEDVDLSKEDISTDEILENDDPVEVDLLDDEPKDELEIQEEDDELRELEMLMDPYELNDY